MLVNESLTAAIYARVSSEQQAKEQTIASQVEALRERVRQDGLTLQEEMCFLDEGTSGKGPKTPRPATPTPAKKEVDSDSEFELTLDDSSGGSSIEHAAHAIGRSRRTR